MTGYDVVVRRPRARKTYTGWGAGRDGRGWMGGAKGGKREHIAYGLVRRQYNIYDERKRPLASETRLSSEKDSYFTGTTDWHMAEADTALNLAAMSSEGVL